MGRVGVSGGGWSGEVVSVEDVMEMEVAWVAMVDESCIGLYVGVAL